MDSAWINLRQFVHLSQGETDWTQSFEAALSQASCQGGGTIYVPPGHYPTFPIQLKSNTTLYLDRGAVLSFSDERERFPIVSTEFEGIPTQAYQSLIHGEDGENMAVTGFGVIEGNGKRWWTDHLNGVLPCARPYLVHFQRCCNVVLENVTLRNSPCWTIHPLYCDQVRIQGIHIQNPPDSPNTDGIDPDGCQNLRIADCVIDVGDDCIAIKSGTEDTPEKHPCENILITGCTMLHGHGGVVIGSEMSGDVRNVVISNCIFSHTDRGIRMKTRRGRGGIVENILVSSLIMEDVLCPFVVQSYYFCGKGGRLPQVQDKSPHPVDASTPLFRNIQINQITASKVRCAAGFFYGLPEMPIQGLSLSNCRITMNPDSAAEIPAMMEGTPAMAQGGFFLRNVRKAMFHDVTTEKVKGPLWNKDDSVSLQIGR